MASLKLGKRENAAFEMRPLYASGESEPAKRTFFLKNWSPWAPCPPASYPQSVRHSSKPQGGLGYKPLTCAWRRGPGGDGPSALLLRPTPPKRAGIKRIASSGRLTIQRQ